MNSFSAFTFTGAAGIAFLAGWSAAASFVGGGAAMLLCGLCLGKWFRQLRVTTFPEALAMRYGESTRIGFAGVTVIAQTLYASLWLYSLSVFASVVFNLPLQTTIILIGLFVTVYTTIGGSWAATAGDFMQAVLLMPLTVILALLCLVEIGGVDGLQSGIADASLEHNYAFWANKPDFDAGKFGMFWTVAVMLKSFMLGSALSSGVRFFTVKDGREAQKTAYLTLFLMLLGVSIWFIPPMTARLLFEENVQSLALAFPADGAYAVIGMQLLPPALLSLLMVGMFSATISSLDSGMNRNVAIVVIDLYPKFCRLLNIKELSSQQLVGPSRALALICGIIIVAMAYYMSKIDGVGIFQVMLWFGALLSIPMSIPMLLCLFVRKAPRWSAFFSLGAGLLSGAMGAKAGYTVQTMTFLTTAVTAGAYFLSIWIGRRWQKSPETESTKEFYRRMKTPINFKEEVGSDEDHKQYTVMGIAIFSLSALLFILCFLSPIVSFLSYALATGYCILGLSLYAFGRRATKS